MVLDGPCAIPPVNLGFSHELALVKLRTGEIVGINRVTTRLILPR
jgi:hypothetical protein